MDNIVNANSENIPLESSSFDLSITSPPYWAMRDYGFSFQLGLEQSPEEYIQKLCDIFDETKRILKKEGTLFVVIDDTYASNWGHGAKRFSSWWSTKSKEFEGKGWKEVETVMPPNQWGKHKEIKATDLIGIPYMMAFEMRKRGWYLRSDIIWYKSNSREIKQKTRPQKKYEHIFMFSKSQKYYYKGEETNLWDIPIKKHENFHSAQFPPEIVERILKVALPKNGKVIDPFCGTNTVGKVCKNNGIFSVGLDGSMNFLNKINE